MDGGSSILAFVQAGLKVCKGIWTYYNTWKDYREDVAFICDSLTGIEKTLTFLQDSMTARPKPPPNDAHDESCRDAVQRCKATMDRLSKKLGKIEDSSSSGGFRLQAKFQWERVKYPLKESTILKLRDLLQETKSDLLLLLAALQFDSSIVASNQWTSLSEKMDQLSLDVGNINSYVTDSQKSKKDKKYKKVLDWVCTVDPSAKHGNTNSRKEPGTCNWLFQRPEFEEWKTQGSVLWIKGEVGRGKSVLCSAAIEHMKLYCSTTPGTILLYYYFSFTDQSKQNTAMCLSSLLRQFCTESTNVMTMVEQTHEKFHIDDNNPKDLTFDDVQTFLRSAIMELKKEKKEVYVVIDALDELPDDREGLQRAQMLKWIAETSSRETHLHVLFTSRVGSSCIDIEKTMESQSRLHQVSIDAITNHDDIRLYLEGQFQINKNLNSLENIAQVNIIEKLIEKSGGMFQWVSCQLDELKGLQIARPKDIEDVLKSMPPTLDECYMRILQGVNSRFQSEVVKALQWISLSFQPLSFREVNEACIIDLTESPVIKKENQFNGDGITACLPSLVTRTGGKETHLSLSHFSVKEFLKSSTIQDSAYSRYGFRESGAHAFIAESCIAYIYYYSSCPMRLDTQNDIENFPLLFYACRYWFEHLKLATEEEQERLAPLIIGFLTCWNVYSNALRIYNPLHPENPFPCIIHTASSLGWAAALGMEVLVKRLLKKNSTEIDTIQDIQYPAPGHQLSDGILTGICYNCNYDDSGSFFMKFHADPIRGTALMKAVAHNHENIVRLLIENGAGLHHIEQGYNMGRNSALSIACHNGNDKMVRVLLGYGADPNEICGDVSALEGAIDSSSLDVCKTLLENGAHVDGSDSTQETPLMYATSNGRPDICKLLLDHGADINWNTKDDSNCPCDILSSVANNGNVKLVELFLSRGIHIRPQALLWSLWPTEEMYEIDDETDDEMYEVDDETDDEMNYDDHEILKKRVCELLILRGANLNPDSTGLFDTPLAMALCLKWHDIFELMLSKGARVNPSDPSCLTAGNILIAASNSVSMTKRILDMGVDANAPGVFVKPFGAAHLPATGFANALQAAAFRHNRGVVELLLRRNADLRITGPPYGSALYAVVGRIGSDKYVSNSYMLRAQKICEILLAKGAKWSIKHLPEDEELRDKCLLGYWALLEWQKANTPVSAWFELRNARLVIRD